MNSTLKLVLHWFIFIIGFYIFWIFTYLLLTKFAVSQLSVFKDSNQTIWSHLTASTIFWYSLFIFGMAVAIYIINQFINYAPKPKTAAVIYTILIVLSEIVLLQNLATKVTFLYIIPHIVINVIFLIPIVMSFFKTNNEELEYEEEEEL